MKDVKKEKIDRDKAIRTNTARHRKKRRRNLSLYYFLMTVLTVSVLVVLSLTVFFKIGEISVEGTQPYAETAIIKRSEIKKGTNLIMLNSQKAEKNILDSFVLIDSVEIVKMFPSSVIIKVQKAENYFQIQTENGLYLIVSSKFKVLSVETAIVENLPLVSKIGIKNATKGEIISEELNDYSDKIKTILNGFKEYGIENIDSISFNSSADIRVNIDNERLEVKLGSETKLEYKIQLVSAVIKNKIEENESGIIDASVEGTATFRPM